MSVLNISRYVVQICFVALLYFGSGGVVNGGVPACFPLYTDPVNGVDNVPVNHQVTVYYKSDITGICKSMVEMETVLGGDNVPLNIVSSREWKGVVGGKHVIWGEVVVQPRDGFISGEVYKVVFKRNAVSSFRVGSGYGARGRFLSSQDLVLNFRNFPNVSIVTPDLVNHMFENIITGLIALRKDHLISDNPRFFLTYANDITNLKLISVGASAGAISGRDSYPIMGELADLFYSFGYYQTFSYGEHVSDSLIWRGLLYYLKRQFPRLFSPGPIYPVRVKKVVYSSVSPNGLPVRLSSVLIYPEGDVGSHQYLVSIHHPTMPSGSAQTDGNTIDVFLGVLLASRGNVVLMSDLLGHGITFGETEPYLIALPVNYEYLDVLRAVEQYFRETFGDDITKLPLALVGFSQGAHDAMEFSHFVEDYSGHKVAHLMALSGSYDVHSTIMGASCVVSGSMACSGGYSASYIGYEGEIHRFAHKVVQAAASYRGLPESTMRQFFDEGGHVSSLAARAFYVNGDYPILHNIAAMGSLPGSDERFNSPNLNVKLYHMGDDRAVPAQNTVDIIEFLRRPDNVLLSVKQGDCREKSLLSKFVKNIWVRFKDGILASHVVCLPYFFNDVLDELR